MKAKTVITDGKKANVTQCFWGNLICLAVKMFASFLRFVLIGCEDNRKCFSVFIFKKCNIHLGIVYRVYDGIASSSWEDGMNVTSDQWLLERWDGCQIRICSTNREKPNSFVERRYV